jgi:D-glycero-D-manno-heptose 1,7-bisphosphate phosphatase
MKEKLVLFLDRDGVINEKRLDYVKNINELKFLPNIFNSIKKFKDIGFMIIIITNQSVVNRKIISEIQLKEIHDYMLKIMEKNSCKIAKIYYCPHHPDEKCKCRKPNTGMIEQAIKEFEIKIPNAILIGDSESDIEAATRMKMKSIKIQTDGQLLDLIDSVKDIFFKQLNKKCEI